MSYSELVNFPGQRAAYYRPERKWKSTEIRYSFSDHKFSREEVLLCFNPWEWIDPTLSVYKECYFKCKPRGGDFDTTISSFMDRLQCLDTGLSERLDITAALAFMVISSSEDLEKGLKPVRDMGTRRGIATFTSQLDICFKTTNPLLLMLTTELLTTCALDYLVSHKKQTVESRLLGMALVARSLKLGKSFVPLGFPPHLVAKLLDLGLAIIESRPLCPLACARKVIDVRKEARANKANKPEHQGNGLGVFKKLPPAKIYIKSRSIVEPQGKPLQRCFTFGDPSHHNGKQDDMACNHQSSGDFLVSVGLLDDIMILLNTLIERIADSKFVGRVKEIVGSSRLTNSAISIISSEHIISICSSIVRLSRSKESEDLREFVVHKIFAIPVFCKDLAHQTRHMVKRQLHESDSPYYQVVSKINKEERDESELELTYGVSTKGYDFYNPKPLVESYDRSVKALCLYLQMLKLLSKNSKHRQWYLDVSRTTDLYMKSIKISNIYIQSFAMSSLRNQIDFLGRFWMKTHDGVMNKFSAFNIPIPSDINIDVLNDYGDLFAKEYNLLWKKVRHNIRHSYPSYYIPTEKDLEIVDEQLKHINSLLQLIKYRKLHVIL